MSLSRFAQPSIDLLLLTSPFAGASVKDREAVVKRVRIKRKIEKVAERGRQRKRSYQLPNHSDFTSHSLRSSKSLHVGD
jgi:hypothetical protein